MFQWIWGHCLQMTGLCVKDGDMLNIQLRKCNMGLIKLKSGLKKIGDLNFLVDINTSKGMQFETVWKCLRESGEFKFFGRIFRSESILDMQLVNVKKSAKCHVVSSRFLISETY